ncbi:ornithine cyclodeaminase family protein [Armatimonas sp.]|uniref:ornithine cyclodeaminase family protein n=1 Tax=Armatimonas sp. TaxID=1872638 RepID=UPI00286D655C|nr:ornithine cyclodeaminase family protein [Armatimonas sp.]
MPLFLTEEDVLAVLTMPDAIAALETAFLAQAQADALNQPRQRIFLPSGVLHHMAAALPVLGVMGTKTYTSFADGTRFYVQLFSSETGELLAFLEANRLGQIRTGAATGLAIKYMARTDTPIAALFGTGFQAETQAEALVNMLPNLREVQIYSPNLLRRQDFCQRMTAQLGVRFTSMESPEATVRNAKVIVTATNAHEPFLRGAWLTPGDFLAAVGANRLSAREIDDEAVSRANVVAVDDLTQAQSEAAELLFAHERRKFLWKKAIPLSAVVVGRAKGRPHHDSITLFKSLGVALEDIAVAAMVYEKAKERGLGRPL